MISLLTLMLRHVDEGECRFGRGQGSINDGFGAADEGVDGPIGRLSGIDVKKFNAGDTTNGVGDGIDNLEMVS